MSLIIKGIAGIFDNLESDLRRITILDDIARILREAEEEKARDDIHTQEVQRILQRQLDEVEPVPALAPAPALRPRPQQRQQTKRALFLGRLVTYQNIPQLANKLKIGSTMQARRDFAREALRNINTPKVVHNVETGLFAPVDLKQHPLLLRQFLGVKRIMKKMRDDILTQVPYEYENPQVPDIAVELLDKATPFQDYDKLSIHYDVTFRIIYSTTDGTYAHRGVRTIDAVYTGMIGNKEYLKHGFVMRNTDPLNDTGDFVPYFNPRRLNTNASPQRVLDYATEASQNPELTEADIGPLHQEIMLKILESYGFPFWIIFDKVRIRTANLRHTFDLEKMRLKAVAYDNIKSNIYNEVIDIVDKNDNCVLAYMTKYYDKIDVAGHFKNIDTSDGIDTTQIIEFCKIHKIKCIAYDIELNVIMCHYPDVKRKQHKSLIYIAYNNHIYPVNNKALHKVTAFHNVVGKDRTKSDDIKPKKKDRPTELCRLGQGKINKMFRALLAQKTIPSYISINSSMSDIDDHDMDGLNIRSYAHDNIFYFVNDDYDDILKLLTLYGVQDKMTPHTNMYNVMAIIEELYGIGGLYSFAPHLKDIKMQGYMFHVEKIPTPEEEKTFMTLDKRKAYPYALSCLKFIQTMDTRTCQVIEKPTEIKETWAYIARPHACTILMHGTNYYDGEHLLFCQKHGVQFDLLYGFETKTHNNPFTSMIDDYYGKTSGVQFSDDTIIKNILNVWIGKMEKGCGTVSRRTRLRKICNTDEASKTQGTILRYDDDTALCFDVDENADIYTRKPISFQIKNMARRVLFMKMKSLEVADADIIQVCVDSVTFINKNNITYKDDNTYKGWRNDKYNRLGWSSYERCHNDILNIMTPPPRDNVLFEAYAGHGKTHWIKNTLIPRLIKAERSYIVLSPSHSTIKEYRQDGLRCDVIQRYEHHDLPTEDMIIIDEIGLCGKKANDTIYRLMTLGRQIYSFGDYNQLLPVNEDAHFNNKIYIDCVYNRTCTFKTNRRNDFTKAYYDSLIKAEINVIDEIKKHNEKDPHKADIIVCHRNETRKKMNDLIMKKKGIVFGSIGCKVMCKVNKFRDMDIYNNFEFIVTDADDEHITLDNKHELTIKQFFGGTEEAPHFIPAYARTMYNMQGDSCKSYHIPDTDIKYFNNGRFAYTLISRLKTSK